MEFAEKYEESYRLDSKIDEKLKKFEVESSDQQRLRKFAGFVGGRRHLLFEEGLGAMLVTSTTSRCQQRAKFVEVSLAFSTDYCTGIHMGNDAKVKGARKCQRHPLHPQQDDRISTLKRPLTTAMLFGDHSNFGHKKYIRYLNCSWGNWLL